jgi:hypothetical protein
MKRFVIAVVAILITGCNERVMTPVQHTELGDDLVQVRLSNDLTFYRFDDTAFQNAPRGGNFWAVKGASRDLVLRYTDTGEEFLRFEVGPQSLLVRPDGTPIVDGDSVMISVHLPPSGEMIFRFSPSGLKFDPSSPARLTINHARSNPDLDGDGFVGFRDVLLDAGASIWKQELPLLPWISIPSLNLVGGISTADINDFTGFGMAVN